MTTRLGFPVWASLAAALCVETLGLSRFKQRYLSGSGMTPGARQMQKPRYCWRYMTGGFYLLTVLTVNAMLDNSPAIYRLAKALLSSLSVCAGVILALRAGHARRMSEAEQARQERKAERAAMRAVKAVRTQPVKEPEAPFLQPVIMGKNGNGTRKEALTR